MVKIILALILTVQFNTLIMARTYFVSNKGNDMNSGLEQNSSWRSITKVNNSMRYFMPGDSILFERGSTFTAQINLDANGNEYSPIVIGAFGEGANPIINGSILITEWSQSNSKYFSVVDFPVRNLLANGIQMIIARYPNSGLLQISEPNKNPKTGFKDGKLKQSANYWNGSNVRVRTTNWTYEHSQIKSFRNGTITFNTNTQHPVLAGWGYYLDNNENQLDTAKEWFYKGNEPGKGGTVYFIPPKDLNLSNAIIEGSVHNYGIFSLKGMKNVVVRDINFRNQLKSGAGMFGKNYNVKFINCTFTGQVETGIVQTGQSNNLLIYNCRFLNINGKAISSSNGVRSQVVSNVFQNIGMIPGYGTTGDDLPMTAIVFLTNDSAYIANNNILNTGHDGINCLGNANVIEKNVLRDILMYLNDGAAIKTYGSYSRFSVWRNNFVFNVPGNLTGTFQKDNFISASGLYLDAYSNNITVKNNTVANCGLSAINFYEGTVSNTVTNNVCFDNAIGIRFFEEQIPMRNNIVKKNLFFGINADQMSIELRSRYREFNPGVFDSNLYYNPSSQLGNFQRRAGNIVTRYNFTQWIKSLGGQNDFHSEIVTGNDLKSSKLFTNMSEDTMYLDLNDEFSIKRSGGHMAVKKLVIPPWSSIVLTSKSETKNPELQTANGRLRKFAMNDDEGFMWYNLIGNNLRETVLIKAQYGLLVSVSPDYGFEESISLEPVDSKINRIIYVKNLSAGDNSNKYVINESGSVSSVFKIR